MNVRRQSHSEMDLGSLEERGGTSFYASAGFARAWETVGGKVVYWTAEENGRLLGALTGLEFGFSPVKRFQAMPDGCYAFLMEESVDQAVRGRVADKILSGIHEAGYAKTNIYDFYDHFKANRRFDSFECSTMLVDISSPNWQPPHDSIRRAVGKAERESVTVQAFDAKTDMARFLPLMEQCEKEHGRKPKYPPVFFQVLAELAKKDSRIQWLWVERNGEAVCSHINFLENNMLVNWQIYFDRKFSTLRPNQYLLFHSARDAAATGIKYLNLGASPKDATGLLEYKSRWGGEVKSYRCLTGRSGLGRLL